MVLHQAVSVPLYPRGASGQMWTELLVCSSYQLGEPGLSRGRNQRILLRYYVQPQKSQISNHNFYHGTVLE